MKIPILLVLGTLSIVCLSCEKDQPEEYPVTMRISCVIPVSDYQFYVGGRKADDPQAMAQFRDIGVPYYSSAEPEIQYDQWTEPNGAQFDRIDFPDADHFRMLWAKGGETLFDVSRTQGMIKLQNQESTLFLWATHYLQDLFQYEIAYNPTWLFGYDCCWGRFSSDRCFEMLWTQIRWRVYSNEKDAPYVIKDELLSLSNAIDESKIGVMGPNDSLVVRHYKIRFTR